MSSLTLQNLTFSYSNPQVTVFEDVSLQIDSGWKTALIGRNGRGSAHCRRYQPPDCCCAPTVVNPPPPDYGVS
ncbi:MAG: hypothetical protein ISR91_01045 [Candidatus Delongbacteria bacterium]|nr:hypothetical protein [Candidatus Delongbacteria bacterium]